MGFYGSRTPKVTGRLSNTPEFSSRTCHIGSMITQCRIERAARPRSSLPCPTRTSCTPSCGARALNVLSRRDCLIVTRDEGHSQHGPATHEAAHAQQRTGSRQPVRQQRRTDEDLHDVPRTAQLLELLEELRRPVVGTRARPAHVALRTKFDAIGSSRELAKGRSQVCVAQAVGVRAHHFLHLQKWPMRRLKHGRSSPRRRLLPRLLPLLNSA